MFGAKASAITIQPRHFNFRYRSAEHFVEVFKTYYGPVLKTFAALPEAGQASLRDDLLALCNTFNRAGDAGLVVPSEYLEIVITKR
jgi:hypothetical protein